VIRLLSRDGVAIWSIVTLHIKLSECNLLGNTQIPTPNLNFLGPLLKSTALAHAPPAEGAGRDLAPPVLDP
jgi:hypothetical protein